jgi:hypothetical protein
MIYRRRPGSDWKRILADYPTIGALRPALVVGIRDRSVMAFNTESGLFALRAILNIEIRSGPRTQDVHVSISIKWQTIEAVEDSYQWVKSAMTTRRTLPFHQDASILYEPYTAAGAYPTAWCGIAAATTAITASSSWREHRHRAPVRIRCSAAMDQLCQRLQGRQRQGICYSETIMPLVQAR